jgi:UDP-glucose 4-epimerase
MSLTNKTILVTGGTGSFGHFIVRRLLDTDVGKIRVFSRDEKKHYDMRNHYAGEQRLHFMLGDIRDRDRVREVMTGCHVVIQAAALKQVLNCETHPYEAIRTNVIGMQNVISTALELCVEKVVTVSTDKAVKPVNVMGMTKALQERLAVAANNAPDNRGTKSCCVRYGNVMSSRGSAIPFFRHLASQHRPITITHPEMTRFLLTLNDAIDLVLYALEQMHGGEIFIKKAPAVRIMDLARVVCAQRAVDFRYEVIGMLPGEKIHEILISEEELPRAQDLGTYYVVQPHWQRLQCEEVKQEYCSNQHLLSSEADIAALLMKSDDEFVRFGLQDGIFLK